MSTLPSIHQHKRRASGSPAKQSRGKFSRERSNVSPVQTPGRRAARFMTQREKEILKAEEIKQSQPFMNKFETAQYRNSYIHNICVRMLKEGFHKSFDELFSLNSKRNEERLEAGPDSIMWEEQPLEEQHRKLEEISKYLTNAEYAARLGKWDDVYACRHALARFFLQNQDFWLSDHFFQTALEVSLNIKLDGRRRESEAHCHMGLACERRGEIGEACQHLLEFYQLTMGRLWSDEDDTNLHHISCRHLCRIYLTLARQTTDKAEALEYLHKAFDVSKEGEDKLQQAGIAYELGRDYEAAHDSETAIKCLEECLSIASEFKNNELIGKSCEALAKSHQTLGGISTSLGFLEMFAATSKRSGRKFDLVDACSCLGTIYNSMGKYSESIQHFSDSYDVMQEIREDIEKGKIDSEESPNDDRYMLEECALQLGVAKGNEMLNAFAGNMEIPERQMMERIIEWKDGRNSEFGNPLPKPSTPSIVGQDNITPDPTEPFRQSDESGQT